MADSTTNLYHMTIQDAAALLKNRELSPVELTRAFLDRIDSIDDKLHSYLVVLNDQALSDARVAESEIISGNYKGPLLSLIHI